RFIFNNKSYITVGGDEHRGYNIKTIGFEYDYDEYYVNEKGERPPKEWFDDNGCIKNEYWDKYDEEYSVKGGDCWSKLKEYEKEIIIIKRYGMNMNKMSNMSMKKAKEHQKNGLMITVVSKMSIGINTMKNTA